MKKAICIYAVYDVQNVINKYICEVLKEISRFAEMIYVVCNFPEIKKGLQFVETYAEKIIYRDNKGFDSGAYKEVILEHIGKDKIRQYDELILTNDTYFAPIYPFDEMFERMRTTYCDFWGITRHPGGYNVDLGHFESHIQSYFLCFGKRILRDESYYSFWKNMKYANNKAEAVLYYELGINRYLDTLGYKGSAFSDYVNASQSFEKGSNPYMTYALELVENYGIPIIKKTNFYGKNPCLVKALKALDYIDKNCEYNTTLIRDYISEYQRKDFIGAYFDFDQMEKFAQTHNRIFIYGAGVWGHNAENYLRYKGIDTEGFVVTKSDEGHIREFSEVDISSGDGIIIAQEFEEICRNIKEYIGNRVSDDMIFTPCYPKKHDK